jgi:hypothetical protein
MSNQIKGSCVHCGGHIAYGPENVGRAIQCPHCGQGITLVGDTLPTEIIQRSSPNSSKLRILSVLGILISALIGFAYVTAHRQGVRTVTAQDSERAKLEAERLKAEAEKAKAEAELAKVKLQQQQDIRAPILRETSNVVTSVSEDVHPEVDRDKERLETEAKARIKNPTILRLWDEKDHDAIKIVSVRIADGTFIHKSASIEAKYSELPEWLRNAARGRFLLDGEAKGLVRELNGKTYDLRTSPPGWVSLPLSEVIQIVDDGYLLIDVTSLKAYAPTKVFKLKHNGLTRILNNGDRIQITAMSVGTYTYETKRRDISRVPAYDPGMPVGQFI